MNGVGRIFHEKRAAVLAAVIVAQAVTASVFLADVIADLAHDGRLVDLHMWIEAIAAVSLSLGIVFLMIELRRVLNRMARLETATRAAQGMMGEVVEGFFDQWALTPSERDVALLVLKGFDNDAIAALRGTAAGTVRAQCTAIYAKAGVDGRPQLISGFLEELLAGELT